MSTEANNGAWKLWKNAYYLIALPAILVGPAAAALGFFNQTSEEFVNVLGFVLPDDIAAWIYKKRYAVAICAFLLLVIVAVIREISNNKRISECMKLVRRTVRANIASYRELVKYVEDEYNTQRDGASRDISLLITVTTRSSLNELNGIIRRYCGNDCHVSVKIYLPQSEEVKTVCRDEFLSHRKEIDEELDKFRYSDNAAFQQILEDSSVSFYASNWLKISAFFRQYWNKHKGWEKEYTSTLVVPISKETHPARIHKDTCRGFLCIDSRRGRLKSMPLICIVQSFSEFYFCLFELTDIIEEVTEPSAGEIK